MKLILQTEYTDYITVAWNNRPKCLAPAGEVDWMMIAVFDKYLYEKVTKQLVYNIESDIRCAVGFVIDPCQYALYLDGFILESPDDIVCQSDGSAIQVVHRWSVER